MIFSELPVGAIFEFVGEAGAKGVKIDAVGYRPKSWGDQGHLIIPMMNHPVIMMCTGDTMTCEDMECLDCGERECPAGEPLHFHHDGCPARCGR